MSATSAEAKLEPLTPAQLAEMVKLFRDYRGWSQETLAEISELNIRTIQRVEGAEPSSPDSRRALARAFELDDLEVFNKPYRVYSDAELEAERKKVMGKYLTLPAVTISSGRQLGEIGAQMTMDYFTQETELPQGAATDLAYLIDMLRDFRDCASEYSEVDKLAIYAEFQGYVDALRDAGYSLCCAVRKTSLTNDGWVNKTPLPVTIVYFTPFKKGDEKTFFMVEKRLNLSL